MENDEMLIEIAKNKADKIVCQQELEQEKNKFINDIMNGIGDEIKTKNGYELNKPIKIKRTFKDKVVRFFQRLNNTI